jgi:hypothetical protein
VDFTSINGTIVVGITVFNHHSVVFFFNVIFWVDDSVHGGIVVFNDVNNVVVDFFTSKSTITFLDIEWTVTISISVIWTVIISPFVFDHDNTLVDFTRINEVVTVVVTVFIDGSKMIWVNVVLDIDSGITVGIIVSNDFSRDSFDIITMPSSWANGIREDTFTVDVTNIWTVFSSPSVFSNDHTFVDFTSIDLSVHVGVTVLLEDK